MSALYVDDGRIMIEILKQGVRFDAIEKKLNSPRNGTEKIENQENQISIEQNWKSGEQ